VRWKNSAGTSATTTTAAPRPAGPYTPAWHLKTLTICWVCVLPEDREEGIFRLLLLTIVDQWLLWLIIDYVGSVTRSLLDSGAGLDKINSWVKMRFLRIIGGPKWDIVSVVSEEAGEETCALLDWFEQLESDGTFISNMDGMLNLMRHVATTESGPVELKDTQCHTVDDGQQIFEFIKGRLRVLWFYGKGNKLVVCSHGFVKKTQKTPKEEVKKCIRVKERYMRAHQDNNIEILDELEGDDNG